jgi:hypothetical protein
MIAKSDTKRDQGREISSEGLKRQDPYFDGRVLQNESEYCVPLPKRETLSPDSDA